MALNGRFPLVVLASTPTRFPQKVIRPRKRLDKLERTLGAVIRQENHPCDHAQVSCAITHQLTLEEASWEWAACSVSVPFNSRTGPSEPELLMMRCIMVD